MSNKLEETLINEKLFEVLDRRESSFDSKQFLTNKISTHNSYYIEQENTLVIQEFLNYLKEVIESDKDLDGYRINLL